MGPERPRYATEHRVFCRALKGVGTVLLLGKAVAIGHKRSFMSLAALL